MRGDRKNEHSSNRKKWRLGLDVILSGLHKVPLENLIKLNNFNITSSLFVFSLRKKPIFRRCGQLKPKLLMVEMRME